MNNSLACEDFQVDRFFSDKFRINRGLDMPVSKAEKAAYNDEIKDIKKQVDNYNSVIRDILVRKKKMPRIAGYYNLEIATRQMDIIDCCLKINDLSVEMLGLKNEPFLNNARKEFYKILQEIEEIVGNQIDRSLRENDDYLVNINHLNPRQILEFIQRLHRIFFNLRSSVGEGSKWKWSFVELQSRVAIITKNITSFSDLAKLRDPRMEFYYDRRDLMEMCKEGLTEAAKQYRTKYELSGKAREDLKKSIDLLAALRKIHVIFGEEEEATKLKNTIDAARLALEAEDKSIEKEKKNK